MTSPLQQKLRISGPVVITGNRLSDGIVVHRTSTGGWSEILADAQVLTTAEEAVAALKAANADGLNAVGPYVAPLDTDETAVRPGNLREHIRTTGPSFPLPSDQDWPALPARAGDGRAAA